MEHGITRGKLKSLPISMETMTLDTVPSFNECLAYNKSAKAFIFDMDGTLLNSEILHARALMELLHNANQSFELNGLLEEFKGVSEPDVLSILIDRGIVATDTDIQSFVAEKNRYFEKYLAEESTQKILIHEAIKEVLLSAKEKKLKVALVTASEGSTTKLLLEKLNLTELFDIIITRDDTEKSKPDPMPYLHCFKQLGLNKDEVLIFEDSETGLAAAAASEAIFIKVNWY